MRKLFPRQYWLSWLGAVLFFGLIFPYDLLGNPQEPWFYGAFCCILSALTAALYRYICFLAWIRRLYVEQYRYFAWPLVILSFCHLVFTPIHWGGWMCIGGAGILLLAMGIGWLRAWLRERAEQ